MSASKNWSGNVTYTAQDLAEPTSVEELQAVVSATPKVRALGSRHSFSSIADTPDTQVSLSKMPVEVAIDGNSRTVTVNAGARYGEFVEELDRAGWALGNLASLPHISVAGAIATGSHGSGVGNGSLAAAVAGIEMVIADGTVISARRGDPEFDGMVVALGTLGILTRVTLDVVPRFEIIQHVYTSLPWDSLVDGFDEVVSGAYSVSIFTLWDAPDAGSVWTKSIPDAVGPITPKEYFGATLARDQRHPLPDGPAKFATQQGQPGAWWARLPHFRLEFTPSKGDELQSEYLLPREHAGAAIEAVRALGPRIRPHLFISELRTIAADPLWLSPTHSVDCLAIHFTWMQHGDEITALLHQLERTLAPFGARPHWGKLFRADARRIASLYPKLREFRQLAGALDPEAKFRNDFVDRWLFGA